MGCFGKEKEGEHDGEGRAACQEVPVHVLASQQESMEEAHCVDRQVCWDRVSDHQGRSVARTLVYSVKSPAINGLNDGPIKAWRERGSV